MVNWYAWPVALGGAVAVTWFVYGNSWKSWKSLLRFLGTFLVIILLFKPSWTSDISSQRKPQIYVFSDISGSAEKQSSQVRDALQKQLQIFQKDYDVKEYFFGSEISFKSSDSLKGATRLDRIAEFLSQESLKPDAAVVITDGILNRGGSPLNEPVFMPMYTIGLGDPTIYPDARVTSLLVNESVFKGNEFEVEATLQLELLKGSTVEVQFLQKGILKSTKTLMAQSNFDIQRIVFNTKGEISGPNELEVKVKLQNNSLIEKNLHNNVQRASIEVISERKKVVLLYQAVHPDIGAIKRALSGVEQYEWIEIKTLREIPLETKVVVAYKIKTETYLELQKLKVPMWVFSDESVQLTSGVNASFKGAVQKNQSVTPFVNPEFPLFSVETIPAAFKSVDCPLLKINVPRENIQLFQQWNRVTTDLPLCFADETDRRKLYFAGFGIWKWRMQEFQQTGESKWFDEWVRSNVTWLSKSAVGNGMEWSLNKQNWMLGEARKFKFALFDGASNKMGAVRLKCTSIDPKGKESAIAVSSNLGVYSGVIRPSLAGRHKLKVHVDSDIPGVSQRDFTQNIDVDTQSLENQSSTANHALLRQWSKKSGGKFFISQPYVWDSIRADMSQRGLNKPRIEIESARLNGQDEILLLCLIVIFFGVEWFLRKWEGKI